MRPTADEVRALLDSDPETGVLRWKRREGKSRGISIFNVRWAGKAAGATAVDGYIQIWVNGLLYRAHQIVWLLAYGVWPDGQLDHRDNNRSNNRISNLRLATPTQNSANAKRRIDNATGFKGVSICRATGRYRARIMVAGKQLHVGRFDTREAAHDAYMAKARECFGDFARAA
jgi:hypothetical protein